MCAGHHNAAKAIRPWACGLSLKWLEFDWNAKDKYMELKNFEMEVTNIFLTRHNRVTHKKYQ